MENHNLPTQNCVRQCVAVQPEHLLSPPYELRTEMNWTDFSGTANPLGMPASFLEAMEHALVMGNLSYTPDRDAYTLRSALARRFSLAPNSFLVGSTIGDMIRAVAQTYLPTTVGIAVPSPVEYALAIGNAGHNIVEVHSPAGFMIPRYQTAMHHDYSFDAALLSNPGYPTSRLLSEPTLLSYLENCTWVIVDERSIELTLGGQSMASFTSQYKNLVVIGSLCESFAIPGIPISYCIAHPDTIAQINSFFDSSTVNMFAEVLGEVALSELDHLEQTREFLDSEIPWLQCMLNLIPGISIYPAEANYVMCTYQVSHGMELCVNNVDELTSKLQLSGFLIRKLKGTLGLPHDNFFCVSVRTREDSERLIAAMREIILGN